MMTLQSAIDAWKSARFHWLIEGIHHAGLRRVLKGFAIVVSVASVVGIAALVPRMAPIQEGTPAQFWRCSSGVKLGPDVIEPWAMEFHLVDHQWVAYELGGLHGTQIYRVPIKDILPQFDQVVESLQQELENGNESAWTILGYAEWKKLQFANELDVPFRATTLIRLQKEACWKKLRETARAEGWDTTIAFEEQLFQTRWHRANWYWANVVFEGSLFIGLACFIAWPVLRGRSPLRWAIHVALSPGLLLLPTFLGYATMSFTSAGPAGGILYPFVIRDFLGVVIHNFIGGSMNRTDQWLLDRLPQILEPLSTSIGSPTALSGLGRPGPTSAVIFGFELAAFALGALVWIREADHERRNKVNDLRDVEVPAEADPRPMN